MTVKSDRKWLTHRRTFFLLLSGAQGAGKTTMLQMLKYVLASQGEYSRTNQGEADLRLCTICEGATKLILHQQSAAPTATATSPVHFQNTLLEYQTACEREAYELAHNGNADDIDVLIISDRGRLDGKLYCSAETWEAIDGDTRAGSRSPRPITRGDLLPSRAGIPPRVASIIWNRNFPSLLSDPSTHRPVQSLDVLRRTNMRHDSLE
jgi:energy-coupling factor transporter ATP-binding protein EcfA2